jgi:hypothetical protein
MAVAHTDAIAAVNLARRYQGRERLYEQVLDGALQPSGAEIGALPSCPAGV